VDGCSSAQVLGAASAGKAQEDRPCDLMCSVLSACTTRAATSVTRQAGRERATASLASPPAQSDRLVELLRGERLLSLTTCTSSRHRHTQQP
jgi:hypothetical protein